MSNLEKLHQIQTEKLLKAIGHLEYSYRKILQSPTDPKLLDEEMLETWESFAARFCRVAELFLTKYIRTAVLLQDPGFGGSLRDFLNQAEKLMIIDDVESWMRIRELRNISAHDDTDKDLAIFFEQIKQDTPQLLEIQKTLK